MICIPDLHSLVNETEGNLKRDIHSSHNCSGSKEHVCTGENVIDEAQYHEHYMGHSA